MADPRRMTPEEHGEAHALLVRAVTDPNWQVASQALDDLMRKLIGGVGCWRPRSASPSASRGPSRRNGGSPASAALDSRSKSAGGFPLGPPAGAARSSLQAAARATWPARQPGSRASA
jgi:hypothetical protein